MTYTVTESFRAFQRQYKADEVHDFAEWPDDKRQAAIKAHCDAGLIRPAKAKSPKR